MNQKYKDFEDICASINSTCIIQENIILSVGRDFLPTIALKVLDEIDLTAEEELKYYNWLIDSVKETINDNAIWLNIDK